jgi:hypothetical protein
MPALDAVRRPGIPDPPVLARSSVLLPTSTTVFRDILGVASQIIVYHLHPFFVRPPDRQIRFHRVRSAVPLCHCRPLLFPSNVCLSILLNYVDSSLMHIKSADICARTVVSNPWVAGRREDWSLTGKNTLLPVIRADDTLTQHVSDETIWRFHYGNRHAFYFKDFSRLGIARVAQCLRIG